MPSVRTVLCIGNDPVPLNLRCSLLREHGWIALTSGSGHDGIRRFGKEDVDAVVVDLNDDGSEAALITGEIKRLKPQTPVVILVTNPKTLAPDATKQADAIVVKADESRRLLDVLAGLVWKQ
jgi:CheY-like chemotaxis protein